MQCQQQRAVSHTHLWASLHDITDLMQSIVAEAHS